ncbi:MAG: aspartate carbamoyltransferase regulatory subunit [Candidatus Bathyarchaeota archaeon]|nr:aspartate carbamoyltransferase regulatory subunit [Candidatus Bathyarchaeota archaeon]
MVGRVLRVSKIHDGTVIDHICGGYGLEVVKILGITGREGRVLTIGVNVPSRRFGVKDVLKVEGRVLNASEVNRIALVAPHATINIIRDFRVVEKLVVKLPRVIEGLVRCVNPACVSNSGEPVVARFYVECEEPLLLKCHYCGSLLERADVLRQL